MRDILSSIHGWARSPALAVPVLLIVLTLLPGTFHTMSRGPLADEIAGLSRASDLGMPSDVALSEAAVLPEGGSLTALAVHSLHPATVFAGTSGSGVAVSHTGGQQWQMADAGLPVGADIRQLIPDPQHPDIVYAIASPSVVSGYAIDASTTDLFKSLNGGQSWHALGGGLPDPNVTAFAVDPVASTTLYAATFSGLYKSLDGGARWVGINTDIANISINGIAIDTVNRHRIWLATGSGVYASLDGGDHWITPETAYQFYTNMVLLKPGSPNVLLAATFGGVEVSQDSGLTWVAHNSGLLSPSIFALALSAAAPQTIYAATASGLFVSRDSGQDWLTAAFAGRPVRTVAVDPLQAGVAYAGAVDGGGVFVTHDAGQTWIAINHGLHAVTLAHLVTIPGSRIIFGSSPGDGIFRSLDGGQTWTAMSPQVNMTTSPATAEAQALVAGALPGQIFATLTPRLFAQTVVVRSDDSGTSWTATQVSNQTIEQLAVDPYNSRHLYASGHGNAELLYSNDAGATWAPGIVPVGAATSVTALLADPWQAGRAYAAIADSAGQAQSLLVTTDGGATWRSSAAGLALGPDHHAITALLSDPQHSGVLYALGDGLYQSTTSGATWQLTATFTSSVTTTTPTASNAMVALPASVGLLATDKGLFAAIGSNVWHSTDGSTTWMLVAHVPSGRAVRSLAALPDGTVILATDGQIWRLPSALLPAPLVTATTTPALPVATPSLSPTKGTDLNTTWYLADISIPTPTIHVAPAHNGRTPTPTPTRTGDSAGSDVVVALLNPGAQLRRGQVFVQTEQTNHPVTVNVPARQIVVTHVKLPQTNINRGSGPKVAALSATPATVAGIRGLGNLFSVVFPVGGCSVAADTVGRQWYALAQSSPSARLLILNPMPTTATLDIWLSDGTHVQRERPVNLTAGQSTWVSLDQFSVGTMVAAVVQVISPIGSDVLLESSSNAATGIISRFGIQAASPSWLYAIADTPPSVGSSAGTTIGHAVTIFDPGPLTAQVVVTLYDGRGGPPQLVQVSVRPFGVSSLSLGLPQGVAVLGISSTVPLVTMVDRRSGLPVAHNRWIIPVATSVGPGPVTVPVTVFNPSEQAVVAQISQLNGRAVQTIHVSPMQTRTVRITIRPTSVGWAALVVSAADPVLAWRTMVSGATQTPGMPGCTTPILGVVDT